jgi:hypothetical protein
MDNIMTKVYHGSGQKFTAFDYAKIGEHGFSEGYGFYFTDDESIARGYALESGHGFLYTVEFKGLKSLSDDTRTMKRTDFIRFIRALGEDFISNYGDIKTCIECEFDTAESDTAITMRNFRIRFCHCQISVMGWESSGIRGNSRISL